MTYFKLILLSFFLLSTQITSAQELAVPLLFSDHMVLQRNTDIRFWGDAAPNANVKISLNGQEVTTTAGSDGKWETSFPKQKAGGPFSLSISSGETLTFEDVYVGDVWLAGGQSNMEWKLNWTVENWEEEVANSGDFPQIRFFEVPQATAYEPQDKIPGGEWKVANPDNAGNFSAVAWYFSKLNHTEKNVPVGIVESNWGGTPAESWTPSNRLLNVDGYKKAAEDVLSPERDWEKEFKENKQREEQKWNLVGSPELGVKEKAHTINYDDSDWETISIPTKEPLSDVVWIRRRFTVNQSEINSVTLFSGDIVQESFIYVNGKQVGSKSWQEANITFDIDPSLIKNGENVIALRAVNSWNNQVVIGGNNNITITINDKTTDLTGNWKYLNEVEPEMPEVTRYEFQPGFLYNAMIHPVAGYSIKGAIWYQGESNVGQQQYYHVLFESMIEEWRKEWNQGDFPFLFVQLANYLEKKDQPIDSDWARLREAQTQTLSLQNTGMATIIDIGAADDIHPRNKHDVGKRLWLAAKKVAYGEDVVFSGPAYADHSIEGNKIRVSFDYLGSGLMLQNSDKIEGFSIAGSDKEFHWAQAKIEGDQVIVWSDDVDNPVAIRYAWADNPDVSLYNKEGLPAVPFRTDKW